MLYIYVYIIKYDYKYICNHICNHTLSYIHGPLIYWLVYIINFIYLFIYLLWLAANASESVMKYLPLPRWRSLGRSRACLWSGSWSVAPPGRGAWCSSGERFSPPLCAWPHSSSWWPISGRRNGGWWVVGGAGLIKGIHRGLLYIILEQVYYGIILCGNFNTLNCVGETRR